MERNHHQADDQQPVAIVCPSLQQLWPGDHCLYLGCPRGDSSSIPAAGPPDEGNVGPATQAQRYPGTLPQRQSQGLPGDHAPVPAGRGQPPGLPGANGHPVPGVDRPLLCHSPDAAHHAGEPGGPLPEAVLMASPGAYPAAGEWAVPLAGPGVARSDSPGVTHTLRCQHVGAAEDEYHALRRPAAACPEHHDALDDAYILRNSQPTIP